MLSRFTRLARRVNAVRHHGENGDDGITLMELVVSMSLMTVVGAMATTFFVGMTHATDKTVDSDVLTAGARTALSAFSERLMVADSPSTAGSSSGRFIQITPTTAVFYADINLPAATNRTATCDSSTGCAARSAPTLVELALESGQLLERDFACSSGCTGSTPTYPDWTVAANAQTTRRFASAVTQTAGAWLFQPYVVPTSGTTPILTEPNYCAGATAGICGTYSTAAAAALQTVIRVDVAFTLSGTSGVQQDFTGSANIVGNTT